MSTKRIEYIDLAKGLCIGLVVSYHIDLRQYFYEDEKLSNFFFAFRMPLYYILSGIFLSIREGEYMKFIQRKTNRLVVPFVFFIVITNIYFYIKHLATHTSFQYTSPLYFLLTENEYKLPNNSLWFLASLYTTYMIYAILHYSFKGNAYKIYALCLLLGIIGYLFGMYKINIPFYLDTSLTCMPFVCAGVIIRENTTFLTNNNNKIYNLALSLICFLVVYLSCRGVNMFYENTYANNYSVVLLTGICGSLGVILLCKTIVKLPIISYMGRYSIIVLGVHAIIINEMEGFFPSKFTQIVYWEIITFVVTIIISCALIHLFTKYIPFFVAQKDFIQFTFLKKQ